MSKKASHQKSPWSARKSGAVDKMGPTSWQKARQVVPLQVQVLQPAEGMSPGPWHAAREPIGPQQQLLKLGPPSRPHPPWHTAWTAIPSVTVCAFAAEAWTPLQRRSQELVALNIRFQQMTLTGKITET